MGIKSQIVEGTKIINEIESSNLVKTEYDIEDKTLIAQFKNGIKYKYENVPHTVYSQFRLAESQGTFFNKMISKNYKYSKVEDN
jgi:hypothetical protein